MSEEMADRLAQLRGLMTSKRRAQPLHALLVPMCDAHNSEYIAACDARLEFVSGFSGSAGTVIVTRDAAALWTDGRYHLQASQQLDGALWSLQRQGLAGVPSQVDWLVAQLAGTEDGPPLVGVDQQLMSPTDMDALRRQLAPHDVQVCPLSENLVDQVWAAARPARPNAPLRCLSVDTTGRRWADKLADARADALKAGATVSVFSALDEVAWLLNMRGADIEHNPVFFAYLVVAAGHTSHLCIDAAKLTPAVRAHLICTEEQVHFHEYEAVDRVLEEVLGEGCCVADARCNAAVLAAVPADRRLLKPVSWAAGAKALKNSVEVAGMRRCHVADAVALCEYLCWLATEVDQGGVTEVSGAARLDALRAQQPEFVSLSFSTISGAGPNGAVIHYHASAATDRALGRNQLYLCDSGGQYLSGTTDVTRTVHLGAPGTASALEREAFTRVLTAHAELARAVFPVDTRGSRLDALARVDLWRAGLDYAHGTGHGVGAFLNVHEGPCGIMGARVLAHELGLRAGMIVTIEPGLYLEGRFGVRLENVVLVVEAAPTVESELKAVGGGVPQLLSFEPLTLVPIQRDLVEPRLLSADNLAWLNQYHARVRDVMAPELLRQGKPAVHAWLMRQTEPLG